MEQLEHVKTPPEFLLLAPPWGDDGSPRSFGCCISHWHGFLSDITKKANRTDTSIDSMNESVQQRLRWNSDEPDKQSTVICVLPLFADCSHNLSTSFHHCHLSISWFSEKQTIQHFDMPKKQVAVEFQFSWLTAQVLNQTAVKRLSCSKVMICF